MSLIICNMNIFINEQTVYVVNQNGEREQYKFPLETLKEGLLSLCYSHDIYNIHFYGVYNFITKYANDIIELEKYKYSKNKIQVEVN